MARSLLIGRSADNARVGAGLLMQSCRGRIVVSRGIDVTAWLARYPLSGR